MPDGSWLSLIGPVPIRVIDADIMVTTAATGTRHHGRYRLLTTLTDHRVFPALRTLSSSTTDGGRSRTTYLQLKATMLGGRVLRAQTPQGIDQKVYALLCTYQALRLAIADATATRPGLDPDRASFTIALHAARDQVIHAAGVIAATTIDLVGTIGRAVLADLLPSRRDRHSPSVVKRAISKRRATGDIEPAPTTKPPSAPRSCDQKSSTDSPGP